MNLKLFVINLVIGIMSGIISNWLSRFVIRPKIQHGVSSRISSLWSVVVVVYVFVALYLVEERWLLPLKYRILIVPLCFLFILFLTYLLNLIRRRPWQELFLICIIPAVLIYTLDPLFPKGIYLQCPSFVSDDAVVKGLVRGEEWKINVLVHPLKTFEWWVQQVPIPDQAGHWEARAVFGGTSGDQFEVLAIAIPKGNLYHEGEVIQAEQIPRSVFKSKICQAVKR